jgi:tetratricopeptide (TPR) repeat protein/predicted aspartyl protease
MGRRTVLVALLLAWLPIAPVMGACALKVAELPVTMSGMRPMVHAQINGSDALFIADSGAFYSALTPAAAAQYKLHLSAAPFGFGVSGVGGEAQVWLTRVETFTILNVAVPHVEFLVAGNDLGRGAVGLLGQNVFRLFGDVEYDLAAGVIRLVQTKDCRNSPLAYWAKSQPFSVIDIDWASAESPHTTGDAYVNGARIRVLFDTGAGVSTLSLDAAKRAGITPDSAGVIPAGMASGMGRHFVPTWIAPFASFKIGDEEIRNTRLRIGALALYSDRRPVDMLLGPDFFLSHRVYVANSQRKLYFTYNGGPVFDLTTVTPAAADAKTAPVADATPAGGTVPQAAAGKDAEAGSAAASAAAATSAGSQSAEELHDASAFSRRGTAFAARHDFTHAIADLTRACELAPGEADYFYQRGMAYLGNRQADLALADFDRAVQLDPNDLQALVVRASLHTRRHEQQAAIADLQAADRAAPREADVRLQLGELFQHNDQFPQAIAQYTMWIEVRNSGDVRMASARNGRCWTRALWNQELEQALSDCNAALKQLPNTAALLDSRGLVQLRRGEYDKAIVDYDQALKLRAPRPWTLYGRGIARLRKGLTAEGHADLASATALDPNIAEQAGKYGLTP